MGKYCWIRKKITAHIKWIHLHIPKVGRWLYDTGIMEDVRIVQDFR